ncbi:MAG: M56 family metallopeptidase, partial [Planctomycetaceae bacterium]|nr:M56 family metallopeptidase [Planctomycetaceae bacterium]
HNESPTAATVPWSSVLPIVILSIWVVGTVGFLVHQLRRWTRFACVVYRGTLAPAHLTDQIADIASLLHMKAPVCLVVKGIASPLLWCAGAARLIWPDAMSRPTDVANSRGMIAHEVAHLRRRDHWISWLELTASILWWWNPLFWFARRRLREAAEMSCDALAIASLPECRHEYAELLLQLSSRSADSIPAPVLAMSSGSIASFERRLRMILSSRVSGKTSNRGVLTMAVVAIVALPYWPLAQSIPEAEPLPHAQEQVTPAQEPMPAGNNIPKREFPEPDCDGIYWSKYEDDHWRAGLKVIQWPTSESPLLIVEHVLQNRAAELRTVDLAVNGQHEQTYDVTAGNAIQADIGGGSLSEIRSAGANEILQDHRWRTTFDFTGLESGDYTVRMGSAFTLPVPDQVGTRRGLPFGLTLPVHIPEASDPPATGADPRKSDSTYATLPIRWGEPVSGLRIGILFPGTSGNTVKRFVHGDLAQAELYVQNTTTSPISCSVLLPHYGDGWGLNIEDSQGNSISPSRHFISIFSPLRLLEAELQAGEIQPITGKLPKFREGTEDPGSVPDVKHVEFRIEAVTPDEGQYVPPFIYGLPTGRYSARSFVLLRRKDIPHANIRTHSSSVQFEVTDKAAAIKTSSDADRNEERSDAASARQTRNPDSILATLQSRDRSFDNRTIEVKFKWDELMTPRGRAAWSRHNAIRFGVPDPGIPEGLPDDFHQPHRAHYWWTQRGGERIVEQFADLETAVDEKHSLMAKHVLESANVWKYLLPCGIGFSEDIRSITSLEAVEDGYLIKGLLRQESAVIDGRQNSFEVHLDSDLIIRRAELHYHVYDIVVVTSGTIRSGSAPATAEQGDFTKYYIAGKGE